MNISKRTLILLILNMILPALLGNEYIFSVIGISKLDKLIYFLVPALYFGSFLLDAFKSKEFKFKIDILTVLLFSLIVAVGLSIIFGINITFNSFTNLIYLCYIVGYIYTIRAYKFEKDDIKKIIISSLATYLFISIFGILQYIFRFGLIYNGITKYPGAIGRIVSTMATSTHLDKYLVYNMLFLLYFIWKDENKKNKVIYCISLFIGVIALAFTYSRTGTICYYIAAFVFIVFFLIKKSYLKSIIVFASIIILYLIPGQNSIVSSTASYANNMIDSILEKTKLDFLSPVSNAIFDMFIIDKDNEKEEAEKPSTEKPSTENPAGNTGNSDSSGSNNSSGNNSNSEDDKFDYEGDLSNASRDMFDNIAKKLIKKYTVFGIGIGNYNQIVKEQNFSDYIDIKLNPNTEYRYSHNMTLYMFVETGAIGVALLLSILVYLFVQMIKNKNIFIGIVFTFVFILTSLYEPIIFMRDLAPMFIIMYTFLSKKSYDSNL